MKKSDLFLVIGFVLLLCCFPALYWGAVMAARANTFFLFPLPVMVCILAATGFFKAAENAL